MNKIKNKFVCFIIFCTTFVLISSNSYAGLYDILGGGAYQRDVDIIRLNDLQEIGGYIEEYKKETGDYPYSAKSNIPVIVNIATKEQQEIFKNAPGPPFQHTKVSAVSFTKELEKGLARKIKMPFDLQRRPNGRQNFYSYMIVEGRYYLAVHLYNEYSFAEKVAENWFKVQISNISQSNVPIWKYEELLTNPHFHEAISQPVSKPDYFKQLREKIRNEIGF